MKKLEWIPPSYMEECLHSGKLERLNYETEDYFHKGRRIEKHAWVYVPYGYEKGEMYPSVYFMHGAATDLDSFLWPAGQHFLFFHILNHMIENGDIPPLIMIFPTYYQGEYGPSNCTKETDLALASCFPDELRHELIPEVEKAYMDAAADYSLRNRTERKRRIFTGFSMGSVITWNVFCDGLDLFSSFGMLSGDCWKKEWMGGSKHPEETADILERAVKNRNYHADDFSVFAYTGEKDPAYTGMSRQIEQMYQRKDLFSRENLSFHVMEKGLHHYDYGFLYLYHCLKEWKERG